MSAHDDDDYPTTGHEWDGIREYDKPMPRWWLITFYITIAWGVFYTILFPAWPLVSAATPGLLGYASRAEVAEEIAAVDAANAALNDRLVATALTEIGADADLSRYAMAGGAAVFRTYCAQCHGAGAAGAVGYPNLLDDDWLWGGDIEAIHATIAHGIRWEEDYDTRYSEMPAFGEILEEDEITAVVDYVLSLSGRDHDAALLEDGKLAYEDNCASCHGEMAEGDREQGAPNLSDAIWLYGSDRQTITETVTYARFGIMPAWTERLSEAQLAQVAFYVHSLGGGEAVLGD